MEINNTTRNRRLGYLGAAVATLLTPAGKLISSAVAAGVTVALITMNEPKIADVPKPPAPHPVASAELIQEYFANELADTSDLSIPVTGAEVLVTKDNAAGLQLTSMPSAIVISSNSANGPSGGNFFEMPAIGSGFNPPDLFSPKPQVDCEQVVKKDASERTELEKTLCEALITQTGTTKEEIVQLIAEVTPTTGEGSNLPSLVVSNDPTQDPVDDEKLLKDQIPPKNKPEDRPNTLPSEPVFRFTNDESLMIAAIPEPSTIGLLLLGLLSLGWVSRRNTGA